MKNATLVETKLWNIRSVNEDKIGNFFFKYQLGIYVSGTTKTKTTMLIIYCLYNVLFMQIPQY